MFSYSNINIDYMYKCILKMYLTFEQSFFKQVSKQAPVSNQLPNYITAFAYSDTLSMYVHPWICNQSWNWIRTLYMNILSKCNESPDTVQFLSPGFHHNHFTDSLLLRMCGSGVCFTHAVINYSWAHEVKLWNLHFILS